MKKIFLFTLCLIFICGCSTTADTLSDVVIKLPNDDTVNGYRDNSNDTSGNISWSDIEIVDQIPDTQNSESKNTTDAHEQDNSKEYCGNKNSKKFHEVSCSAVVRTKDENKVYYNTREEFIEKGFTPCKICNP